MIYTVGDTGCRSEAISYASIGATDPNPTVTITGPNSGNATHAARNVSKSFTSDSTGTGKTFLWDFGDGGTSTSEDPSHTFTTAGVRTVTVVVKDRNNVEGPPDSIVITVDPTPVAVISTPLIGAMPLADHAVAVQFGSTGSIGTGLTYDWDFGDSTAHGTTAAPSHTYSASTSRTVTLVVTDRNGVASAPVTLALSFSA